MARVTSAHIDMKNNVIEKKHRQKTWEIFYFKKFKSETNNVFGILLVVTRFFNCMNEYSNGSFLLFHPYL